MKLKNLILTLLAVPAMLFSSCEDKGGDNTGLIYTDIVTVESIEPTSTTFTFREKENSALLTLIYAGDINKNLPDNTFKEDTRIVISYKPNSGKHYASGTISLIAASNIYGAGEAVPEVEREGMSDFMSSQISLNSLWRTGDYINAVFAATTGKTPLKCEMVADAETLDNDYPQIHLIFKPDESLTHQQYIFYMSYSLKDIFARSKCKGVEVFFNDPNMAAKSVTIKKTSGSFTPTTPTL